MRVKTRRWLYYRSINVFSLPQTALLSIRMPKTQPVAKPSRSMLLRASWSVARATYLRRSWAVQLVQKHGTGLRDVLRASVMLPERSDKQQQQQLSQKVSAGQAVSACEKGALREQRISGVLAPLSSFESLPLAFVMCSERP